MKPKKLVGYLVVVWDDEPLIDEDSQIRSRLEDAMDDRTNALLLGQDAEICQVTRITHKTNGNHLKSC